MNERATATMKANIVTLCHSAAILEGQLSVLGAIQIIDAPTLPHELSPITLAARVLLNREGCGSHTVRLTIVDAEGKFLDDSAVHFRVEDSVLAPDLSGTCREYVGSMSVIRRLSKLEFRAYGEYMIHLKLDDQPTIRSPLYVRQNIRVSRFQLDS